MEIFFSSFDGINYFAFHLMWISVLEKDQRCECILPVFVEENPKKRNGALKRVLNIWLNHSVSLEKKIKFKISIVLCGCEYF